MFYQRNPIALLRRSSFEFWSPKFDKIFQVQLSDDVDEVGMVKFKGGKDATWMFRWKLPSLKLT